MVPNEHKIGFCLIFIDAMQSFGHHLELRYSYILEQFARANQPLLLLFKGGTAKKETRKNAHWHREMV